MRYHKKGYSIRGIKNDIGYIWGVDKVWHEATDTAWTHRTLLQAREFYKATQPKGMDYIWIEGPMGGRHSCINTARTRETYWAEVGKAPPERDGLAEHKAYLETYGRD